MEHILFKKVKKELIGRKYTKEYADFIYKHDEEKILGYFEMDIDPAGHPYEYVLRLRKILRRGSNKIIPVWHKNRGIEDFKDMCKNPIHKDRIVPITGFKNEDIKDEDYIWFVRYAHAHNYKIHCLGIDKEEYIKIKVPFGLYRFKQLEATSFIKGRAKVKVGHQFKQSKKT